MRYGVGFGTDIGLKRQQNQDSGATHPDLGLFIVADGMGGHRGGEIASALSVESIGDVIRHIHAEPHAAQGDWNPRQALTNAIQTANHVIFERSIKTPELQGMGTTTTAIILKDSHLTIGHVGDSRCYFLRPGLIWQLTRDHSLVQEKLRAGLITRDQVKTDQMKNVITRSVGFGRETSVELYDMQTEPGDLFLLCSDGLSGLLEDHEILVAVEAVFAEQGRHALQTAVQELISGANNRGGHDNITAILIEVLPDS